MNMCNYLAEDDSGIEANNVIGISGGEDVLLLTQLHLVRGHHVRGPRLLAMPELCNLALLPVYLVGSDLAIDRLADIKSQ